MSDDTTAHCGHIDSPCACDNAPDPVQAYHAMRRERDEARAALAERDATIALWCEFTQCLDQLLRAYRLGRQPPGEAIDRSTELRRALDGEL